MADAESILKEVKRLEKEAYQRGWDDAVARILAAASKDIPVSLLPTMDSARPKPDIPMIELIHDIIKKHPGLRGASIFRRVVARIPGSDFKTVDRTGRTSLSRLKKRGRIGQINKKWYPRKVREENI